MKKHKNIIFALLLVILMGIEGVIANKIYFPDLDIETSGFFIFLFGICFWGVIFFLPKLVVWLILGSQIILTSVLLLYHNYFTTPLSLSIIFHQYREGADFISKVPEALFNIKSFIVLLVGILNFYVYNKCHQFFKENRRFLWIFFIPLGLLIYCTFSMMSVSFFSQTFFEDACRNLGYKSCWLYETAIGKHNKDILNDIIKMSNDENKIKYNFPKSKNIYVIQVESLTYNVLNQKIDGQEITPFLNRLTQKGNLAEVNQRVHGASANTDFFINSGGYSEKEFAIIYHMFIPQDIYPHIQTLAQKAAYNGYATNFFHNYKGSFFNREPHIKAQKYQNIYFYEAMENKYPKDFWGISDKDLFNFVLNQRKKSVPKNFNFIITLSSHSDYKIKNNDSPLIKQASGTKDDYFNAINFVDKSIKYLVENSPEDSLFIIYGDHGVEEFGYKNIPLIIYSKKQPISPLPTKIEMAEMIAIIHNLFE